MRLASAGLRWLPGASRGIGRAIAVELARNGFDVIINYASNEAAAKEAQAEATAAANDAQARFELCQADISEKPRNSGAVRSREI